MSAFAKKHSPSMYCSAPLNYQGRASHCYAKMDDASAKGA